MTEIRHNSENPYYKVAKLLKQAQSNVVQTVNKTMVLTYFEKSMNGKGTFTHIYVYLKIIHILV